MSMETITTTANQSSLDVRQVALHPGFKGFVSGVVNADYPQRVFLEVKEGGRVITSATFEARGNRVQLINTFNQRPHWSFGPMTSNATLYITITSYQRGVWVPSKMVGPLSITKNPEPDYPMTFHVSTIVSEDGADASHDDCTVTILEYK